MSCRGRRLEYVMWDAREEHRRKIESVFAFVNQIFNTYRRSRDRGYRVLKVMPLTNVNALYDIILPNFIANYPWIEDSTTMIIATKLKIINLEIFLYLIIYTYTRIENGFSYTRHQGQYT